MDIKSNLFISNMKYSAMYTGEEQYDIEYIDNLVEINDFSDNNWSILIQFIIGGLDNIKNNISDNDVIALLTYSELHNHEYRFDGMHATQIKNDSDIKKDFGIGLPSFIELDNVKRTYLKILYLPNALNENNLYNDPFFFILNDTEYEIGKFTFPLRLMRRGVE